MMVTIFKLLYENIPGGANKEDSLLAIVVEAKKKEDLAKARAENLFYWQGVEVQKTVILMNCE